MNVIITFYGRAHIGNPDVSHRSFTSHSVFPLSLKIMFHPCVFCFRRVGCLLISGRNHTVCGIIYWGKYFCIYHVIGDILKMSSSSSVSMPIVLPVPVCFCVHSTPGSVEVCMDQSTHQSVGQSRERVGGAVYTLCVSVDSRDERTASCTSSLPFSKHSEAAESRHWRCSCWPA